MLQESKNLQQRAVLELFTKAKSSKRELTFRAPTGSGKTHMMADFMNRVLHEQKNVVFLVSTLSKGGLAEQNYDSFKRCADSGDFVNLNPYLISTETSGEETLFIPTDYNVYVLPRDLYKKSGKLMQGAMLGFLKTMTDQFFQWGMKKHIWLIKDECHVATNNLDDISVQYFQKVFNFSATPNLRRGQVPDVEITDDEAEEAYLIKNIELNEDDTVPVDAAIDKLLEIRHDYNNLLATHPCLIIQISNSKKAQEEWEQKIKPAIDKHQELKWMLIVNKEKECDTNDDVKKRLPVNRWKDYARGRNSTIDIIVFKMVISEGWDIPRACMLYQVRDTKSKQLDEQVVGRVRRNPRLLDFETLSEEAKQLAMKAWVWGVKPDNMKKVKQVTLWDKIDTRQKIKIKTTKLANLTERKDFNVTKLVEGKPKAVTNQSIFVLWQKLEQCPNEVQEFCYQYAGNSPQRWWRFAEMVETVCKEYDNYICDYDKSIEVMTKDVSFPIVSSYMDTVQSKMIDSWIWQRKDSNSDSFAFDSAAERQWADVLKDCERDMAKVKNVVGEERCLWGKNFLVSSEIKYQYYLHGFHDSFPDFVMVDKFGRIHIFEVKSVNKSSDKIIDSEEYEEKVAALKNFYLHCSAKLVNHIFYLPILDKDDWKVFRYKGGEEKSLSTRMFKESLEKKD
jgi:type III restriction enzyme